MPQESVRWIERTWWIRTGLYRSKVRKRSWRRYWQQWVQVRSLSTPWKLATFPLLVPCGVNTTWRGKYINLNWLGENYSSKQRVNHPTFPVERKVQNSKHSERLARVRRNASMRSSNSELRSRTSSRRASLESISTRLEIRSNVA